MAALDSIETTFPPLFDVAGVWRRLWQRRLTVLACAAATLALALVYLAITKPTYTATASLLIDPRDARSTGFETVLPGIGADSAAVASQVFVIESRDLLMAVFDGEGIEHDAEFAGGGVLSALTGAGSPEKDAVFRRFERRVTVERAGLTYVIDVSFKSESAEKAARIANAIVERYNANLAGQRESANGDINTRLADRTAALQKNVTEADRAVGNFRALHEILDPGAGGTLKDQTDQLTRQLIDARSVADQARGKYDQAMAAGTSGPGLAKLSEIVSSVALDRLRADYNQRASELANAEAVYQARHPSIRRLRSELARTEGLMAAEAGRFTRELKAKSDLAADAVTTLEAKLEALRGKSRSADAARIELRRLEGKAEAVRKVLDEVLKRTEETAQMRGLQLSEAKIIGVAAPPVQPTWPTPLLLLPVSAVAGLLAGCGLAVAAGPAERRPQRVSRSETLAATSKASGKIMIAAPVPLFSLGHYELPGQPGTDVAARIRAMRRRFLHRGGEAFSQNTLKLVRSIVARLNEHPAPYRLLISSLHGAEEAKLAGAMIGIGLQHAGQNVLVVELTSQPWPPEASAGVFVNGASGLPTLVHALASAEDARAFVLEEAVAGGDFDFVLLLAPPVAGREWRATSSYSTDLMLFALTAEEGAAPPHDLLRRHLRAEDAARSATLVIAAGKAGAVPLSRAAQ